MEEEATEARSAHAPCVEPNRMCFLPVPAAAAASKGSSLHMFFNSERVWQFYFDKAGGKIQSAVRCCEMPSSPGVGRRKKMQTMFRPGGGNVSVLLFVEIFLFFSPPSLSFCSVICSLSFFFHSIVRRALFLLLFFFKFLFCCSIGLLFSSFISYSFVVIFSFIPFIFDFSQQTFGIRLIKK